MYIIKMMRTIFLISGVSISSMAWAVINLDFSNYRSNNTIKIVGGSVTGSDFSDNDIAFFPNQSQSTANLAYTNIFSDPYQAPNVGRINQFFGAPGVTQCPVGLSPTLPFAQNDKDLFAQWVNNNVFPQKPILSFVMGSRPSYEYYSYPAIEWMSFTCKHPNGTFLRGVVRTRSTQIVVPPPPPPGVSVCSLNSQNLNLTYSAVNTYVTGLMQSTRLNISCTAGDAKDYQLKLTGSNVINGRLNFSNGVSAEISLNGTTVQANGAGIQLKGLTSGYVSVDSTLLGSANNSGTSNANGILVLEAL